jgi:hypothetical protein
MALSLAVLFSRTGFEELKLRRGVPPSMFQVSVFGQAIILIGAMTLRNRPALGFFIFGGGFLALAASLLVLLPWERPLAIPVAVLLVPGLVFTGVGMKER